MATITTAAERSATTGPFGAVHSAANNEKTLSTTSLRTLSNVCLVAGFASILAAIVVWFLAKEPDLAHGERFGIFVGLWAPTFFILSDRIDRYVSARRLA